MKIVLLVSSLGAGGAERVATTLCSAWAARGDEVTLVATFSGSGECAFPLDDAVHLIFLSDYVGGSKGLGKRYGARLRALRQLIRDERPDVVISFLPNVNIAALAATAFSGVPCIVCERSDPRVQPIGWVWRAACGLLYRYADVVSVQTLGVANSIRRVYGGLGKVVAVPNPLPLELLHWHAGASSKSRRTILSLGRLSGEKRVHVIIEVFSQLAKAHPDWDLAIYGDGPERDALRLRISELGLQDRVFLKGRTSEPWRVMSEADVFVLASCYEGFPNTLLEAMGVGLACISTDCPSGPSEITREGADALLVGVDDQAGLRDALERLMCSDSLRSELGERARASVVDRYALDLILSHWDRLFATAGGRV
ncbi:glycosyltransferase family 4 protein [Caenimonas terrae]|uniref:Glycosyltransferase family 4 protein n=1 Tax=Caenimonas terrae TaxID=696074 RepID=A0ABW0NEH9_9BURK